jgi:hypothetical protein
LSINKFKVMGPNFLRCTKILSQCHLFLSFLPHKDTFMDDYDGTYNYNGLKYSPFENLTTFDSLFFMGIEI